MPPRPATRQALRSLLRIRIILPLLAALFLPHASPSTSPSSNLSSASRSPGRVVAYVGVRGGSQRCPEKNIKPFFGALSLLDLKLRVLQRVHGLSGIVVSTDSKAMRDVAATYEGVVVLERNPLYVEKEMPEKKRREDPRQPRRAAPSTSVRVL